MIANSVTPQRDAAGASPNKVYILATKPFKGQFSLMGNMLRQE